MLHDLTTTTRLRTVADRTARLTPDREVLPEQPDRRRLLQAAAAAGTLVWVTPAVQLLSADAAFADGGSPAPCDAPPATASGTGYVVFSTLSVLQRPPTARSSATADGDATDADSGGAGTTTVGPITAVAVSSDTSAVVTDVSATGSASTMITSATVSTPAGPLRIGLLTTQATAQVSADGSVLPTSSSTVASVTLGPADTPVAPADVEIPGVLRLRFHVVETVAGDRSLTVRVVALRVEILSGPLTGVVELARSESTAAFPACG